MGCQKDIFMVMEGGRPNWWEVREGRVFLECGEKWGWMWSWIGLNAFSKLPPFFVMKKIMRNVKKINELIQEFNGSPFEEKWYGAENNSIREVVGVNPFVSTSKKFVLSNEKVVFYPAIRLYYW